MAKEAGTPTTRRNCISTVSCCLCRTLLRLRPLPSRHFLLPPRDDETPFLSLSFSLRILSQSPDTPHVSGSPELRGPAAGCASVRQGARCQKRHPGEELGSRQALDPRSLDSSGSSAHWINPTHQATPTGESPASPLAPPLFSQCPPRPLPVPTPWPGAPPLHPGYPFPESTAPSFLCSLGHPGTPAFRTFPRQPPEREPLSLVLGFYGTAGKGESETHLISC